MNFPGGVTVTLVSTTTTDDGLGNTTTTTTETPWGPCLKAPRYATESTDPRVAPVIVGATIYGPKPPVEINSDDALVIDGVTYQVDGLPGEWPWPAGGVAGVEVPIVRAAGV